MGGMGLALFLSCHPGRADAPVIGKDEFVSERFEGGRHFRRWPVLVPRIEGVGDEVQRGSHAFLKTARWFSGNPESASMPLKALGWDKPGLVPLRTQKRFQSCRFWSLPGACSDCVLGKLTGMNRSSSFCSPPGPGLLEPTRNEDTRAMFRISLALHPGRHAPTQELHLRAT